MLSAYVLILTKVGKVAHVAQALRDLEGVQVAEDITGPYDIIARVQAPGLDQLGRLVASPPPGRGRRHPHPHLHSDLPVAASAVATTATPPPDAAARETHTRSRSCQESRVQGS